MISFRFLAGAGLLALAANATAQYAPQTLPVPAVPVGDADRLAADMRLVATDPHDVAALVEAGELSLRLGDLSGAASLFARADKVDPRNGRVKAGMAGVLLRGERPGEALVYFGQAEGYGLPVASFAADRGLAYDLIGQQGRAQRDYRTALAAHPDDETLRRYALSLAISGQRDSALLQLDPLVRRGDRGAWRTRAFVLAMGGDTAGAADIARRMMAPGQAEGLAPFFGRLPTLNPVDRAFAVQFGEVRPTAQRIADARMAPALPPMAPEIVAVPVARTAPVRVAAADPALRRRGRRDVQVAAAVPAPVVASASALPAPPGYTAPVQLAASAPASSYAVRAPYRTARPAMRTDAVSSANAAMLTAARAPTVVPGSAMPAPRAAAPVVMATPRPVQPVLLAATPTPSPPPRPAPTVVPAATPIVAPTPRAAAPVMPAAAPVAAPASRAEPPVVLAATIAPATAKPARVAVPVTADVSGFTQQFRAARVRDSAAAAANRLALASTPPVVAVTPAPVVAPSVAVPTSFVAPGSARPTELAMTGPAPTVPRNEGAVPSPVLPIQASGDGDAAMARLLSRVALPGDELARAAQVATALSEVTAIRETPVPASVPAASQAPAPVATTSGTHATSSGSGEARPGFETLSPPPAAVADRREPSEHAPPSRRGDPVVAHDVEAPADASTPRSRRGRIRLADQTVTPTAVPDDAAKPTRRGRNRPADQSVTPTTAPEDETRPSRTGRRGADETTGSSRHGRQASADDDAPLSPAQKRAADRKAAADKKIAEAKKLADAQKAADAKAAAEEKKAARAEPQRYWVQVSGGANEADLPKAWSKAQGQATALKGRAGYTTPLRSTNRVLAGPFKSNAEAKAFMDKVRAQGIPAWQFTSESGQKVSKLP